MVGEVGVSQIIVNLPVTNVRGALVAMQRHLDCSTCSSLIWERAADLQTGHA